MKLASLRLIGLTFFVFVFCTGFIKPISIGLEEVPKTERWLALTDAAKQQKLKAAKDPLLKAAIAEALENWSTCVTEARKVSPKSVVYDWALITETQCAKNWADEDPKGKSVKSAGSQLAERQGLPFQKLAENDAARNRRIRISVVVYGKRRRNVAAESGVKKIDVFVSERCQPIKAADFFFANK